MAAKAATAYRVEVMWTESYVNEDWWRWTVDVKDETGWVRVLPPSRAYHSPKAALNAAANWIKGLPAFQKNFQEIEKSS
jgi:hypothetical protein